MIDNKRNFPFRWKAVAARIVVDVRHDAGAPARNGRHLASARWWVVQGDPTTECFTRQGDPR